MNSLMQLKQTTSVILLTLAWFGFLPQMQAAPDALPPPPPDGCYSGFTTAEGCNALQSLTTGAGNTGLGWHSLSSNTGGNYNTGVGAGTLIINNGNSNTAVGAAALLLNTSGPMKTAVGTDALVHGEIRIDVNGRAGQRSPGTMPLQQIEDPEHVSGPADSRIGVYELPHGWLIGEGVAAHAAGKAHATAVGVDHSAISAGEREKRHRAGWEAAVVKMRFEAQEIGIAMRPVIPCDSARLP